MNIKDISLTMVLKPVQGFLKQFHGILFFIVLGGLLITAASVTLTVITSKPEATPQATIQDTFDQDTIDEVEALDPTLINKPSGRTNPFIE